LGFIGNVKIKDGLFIDMIMFLIKIGSQYPLSLYAGTRYSFTSQAVNNGVDLYSIQNFVGHKCPKTTQKYAYRDGGAENCIER
jgi:hypothetical protein